MILKQDEVKLCQTETEKDREREVGCIIAVGKVAKPDIKWEIVEVKL